ncbi:heme exporter protein CcmD [Cupriavidus campinensis]
MTASLLSLPSGHLGYVAGAFGVAFAALALELALLARRARRASRLAPLSRLAGEGPGERDDMPDEVMRYRAATARPIPRPSPKGRGEKTTGHMP